MECSLTIIQQAWCSLEWSLFFLYLLEASLVNTSILMNFFIYSKTKTQTNIKGTIFLLANHNKTIPIKDISTFITWHAKIDHNCRFILFRDTFIMFERIKKNCQEKNWRDLHAHMKADIKTFHKFSVHFNKNMGPRNPSIFNNFPRNYPISSKKNWTCKDCRVYLQFKLQNVNSKKNYKYQDWYQLFYCWEFKDRYQSPNAIIG